MTKNDRINLLYFITRTGMYVSRIDRDNIVSFICGYELGARRKCDFTHLLKQLLAEKFKIDYSSDGWPGQIERLSKRLSSSWARTFKMMALEIVAENEHGGLDKTMMLILKSRITSLIERIDPLGDRWFNENWSDEWLSLSCINRPWFKQLWTKNEWAAIKALDKQVRSGSIFFGKSKNIPTPQLIELKTRYLSTISKSGISNLV